MRRLPLPLALLLLFLSAPTHAQTFDLGNDRQPMTSLAGLWRFHPGDSPGQPGHDFAWADPHFDDSQWPLLRSDEDWAQQGYRGLGGAGWYRFQVLIPANMRDVSLFLPPISSSYEVYADGRLIGAHGRLPPHPVYYRNGFGGLHYRLPLPADGPPCPPRRVTIALRVWLWPVVASFSGGGPRGGIGVVGATSQVEHQVQLNLARLHWASNADQTLALLQTLAGLGALSLFLLRRKETEYLWFSVLMLTAATIAWMDISGIDYSWPDTPFELTRNILDVIGSGASILFYLKLLNPRRTWLLKLVWICLVLFFVSVCQFHFFPSLMSVAAGTWSVRFLNCR